jgi:hypothetical protein
MDRDGKKGVHLDVPINGFAGRLEVIEGPTGRRQRTEAEKARIVAESLMPGVRVADIARKYGGDALADLRLAQAAAPGAAVVGAAGSHLGSSCFCGCGG